MICLTAPRIVLMSLTLLALLCTFSCSCIPQQQAYAEKSDAQLAYGNGQYLEAIEYATKYLQTDHDDTETLMIWANSLMELKRYDEAISVFSQIIILTGDSSLLCYTGTCKNELSMFALAERDFSLALAHDSSLSCALLGRARSRTGLGLRESAVKDIDSFMQLDSLNASAWNMLGLNYREMESNDKARAAYLRALDLDSTKWIYYYNYSTLLATIGEYASALENNRKAMNLNQDNAALLIREKGKIFYAMNFPDSACKYFAIAQYMNDTEADYFMKNTCAN